MAAPWAPPRIVAPHAVREFRAMASPCRIVADDDHLAVAGERLVHELEARWSRFLPTSEVSGANEAAGSLCLVSAATYRLVETAEQARSLSGGLFNPLVADRLTALGYGRTGGPDRASGPVARPVADAPIELFPSLRGVVVPAGTGFDPGGIGKGLAGDLVVEHLVELGATTVQVELGGDVRLHGECWTGGRWSVDVQDVRDRTTVVSRLQLDEGGVATSSVLGRTWHRDGRRIHHLLDPSTGLPCDSDLLTVTVSSSRLWWAEVLAKSAIVAGSAAAAELLARHAATAVAMRRDGTILTTTGEGWR